MARLRSGIDVVSKFPHLISEEMRECDSVACAAFDHLGKAYRITRELWPGLIDCSTVVSQAHWTGAAIQTPFIAETQRLATNAIAVSYDEMLPGDAIYAYPSRRDSPGGRHNHVALYLGKDQHGIPWVLESREETGASLVELNAIKFDGGIRRFCIEPLHIFRRGSWSRLVQRVPKLGRLGCRLTSQYGVSRRHRGCDIYVERSWPVISPINGTIVSVFRTGAFTDLFVGIWSSENYACSLVGPIKAHSRIKVGTEVAKGESLGSAGEGAGPGGCNVIPQPPGACRIHWELWDSTSAAASPADGLSCDWLPSRLTRSVQLYSLNAVYELKREMVGSCVNCD
jgi:hypothetical protein